MYVYTGLVHESPYWPFLRAQTGNNLYLHLNETTSEWNEKFATSYLFCYIYTMIITQQLKGINTNDTQNKMDEFQKHAEWKRVHTKEYKLYN